MQAATQLAHRFIDAAIVRDGRFPAHAAEKSDGKRTVIGTHRFRLCGWTGAAAEPSGCRAPSTIRRPRCLRTIAHRVDLARTRAASAGAAIAHCHASAPPE